ncbi:hypothetical protein H2200_001153 [Cladophialophora chaetospira]|uniref:BTB domain-containing protein n=1 Tax=Cladophialophora chaetospira TaxID=386627 RepID=A0AA38XKC7_9EURO|nr:hypothetical protein H2200_001153 [Cladophialophora chaetospira]
MAAESPPRKKVKMSVESNSTPEMITVDRDGDLILEVGQIASEGVFATSKTKSDIESTTKTLPQKDDASADEDTGSIKGGGATSSTGSTDNHSRDPDKDERPKSNVRCMRIRVSAKVLTLVSPVFNAMLNGDFAEAQLKLNQEDPPVLALPEDDPTAMLSLCLVIHHSPGIHKLIDDYDLLHRIVVLCDKYACVDALRLWFGGQISKFMLGSKFDLELLARYGIAPERMLNLTYLMGDYSLFAAATATLIVCVSPEDIFEVMRNAFGEDAPDGLAGPIFVHPLRDKQVNSFPEMMKAFQYNYIKEFAAIGPALLEQLSIWAGYYDESDFDDCLATIPALKKVKKARRASTRVSVPAENARLMDVPLCHCRAKRMGVLSATLTSLHLWPVQDENVNNARCLKIMLQKWTRVGDICFRDEALSCPRDLYCPAPGDPDLNDLLNRKIEDLVRKMDVGVCLGCLKEIGGIEDPRSHVTGTCRNPEHDQKRKGAVADSVINW